MESPRILIADDQPHIREALELLLKNEGFLPEAVGSPRAVMEAVQDRSFDVLLLDLNYARDTTSGLEGLELLSCIQKFDSALPVVLMTAWANIELALEAMRRGSRDFVQKPWDNEKLLGSLRRQVEGSRLRREKKQEMQDACEIQRCLVPAELPKLRGCDFQAFWRPANVVGGDYFDVIRLNDTTAALCIADVAGKGLPAALLMSNTQASVRSFAYSTMSPAKMCRHINRVAIENTRAGKFTTLFYAILDSASRTLRYTNAGHIPPILLRKDGTIARLCEGGPVLGIFPDAPFEETEIRFDAGDRIILFTDGITEATNASDEEFGEERLLRLLEENRDLSAEALLQTLLERVSSFTAQMFQDDTTLMIASML